MTRKKNITKQVVVIDLDDLDSSVPEGKHQLSRHRTCWQHLSATLHARKRRLTKKDHEAIDGFKLTAQCFLDFPCRERSTRKISRKDVGHGVTKLNKKLDSGIFESYFELLWRGLSEEKKNSFGYLDCLWFSWYREASYKSKVMTWIQNKQIFTKKYVVVPIVIWHHWSVLILCNFDESLESETRKPCMVLLDSLENTDPKRLERDIRKFVSAIFKAEGRTETEKSLRKIPLLIPKVPQQRSDWECGNFVLYFIKLFLDGAPENFSMEGYPYFMERNWFSPEDLDSFCKGLHSELVAT
ncbi:hypothetical protein F8388_010000 [Cannabis sativa]|uniref:Ubiquitin-like protease family profile domain-containing protein n=2 Tax=Cannabis sativa TaxID=3483 RepID=A0AB40E5Z4_CANSA|nr:hypothetical protein G4B88_025281 [Cannabis sativa]KAF4353841.1 hypothetical protein F8388_010000 [Cannabis sativa]KAF4395053.1 hypothetical protein G4B88_017923 [Cannabis sativa]